MESIVGPPLSFTLRLRLRVTCNIVALLPRDRRNAEWRCSGSRLLLDAPPMTALSLTALRLLEFSASQVFALVAHLLITAVDTPLFFVVIAIRATWLRTPDSVPGGDLATHMAPQSAARSMRRGRGRGICFLISVG